MVSSKAFVVEALLCLQLTFGYCFYLQRIRFFVLAENNKKSTGDESMNSLIVDTQMFPLPHEIKHETHCDDNLQRP